MCTVVDGLISSSFPTERAATVSGGERELAVGGLGAGESEVGRRGVSVVAPALCGGDAIDAGAVEDCTKHGRERPGRGGGCSWRSTR